MNWLTPQNLTAISTAIVAVVGAISALIVAIHGHSVATNAAIEARTATTYAKATNEHTSTLFSFLRPKVDETPAATRVVPAPLGPVASMFAPKVDNGLPPVGVDLLTRWLREQHKVITGVYPGESNAETDFSRVLEQLAKIQAGT